MRRRLRALAVVLLAIGLVAAGGAFAHRWWTVWRHLETTDDAYVRGEITPVSPRIDGYVAALLVHDHERVSRGQLLVRLDAREFELALRDARAALSRAKAERASLDGEIALARARIAAARAELAAAEAERRLARKFHLRAKRLAARNVAAEEKLDVARTQLEKAEAGERAAQARLSAAEAELALLRSRIPALDAAVARAVAAVELAQTRLSYTEIRAPVGGVVAARAVRVGQYVRPGLRLMVVVPLDSLWVEANFKETQIRRFAPGQRVAITVDAFPDVPLEGRIESLSPASGAEFSLLPPENATGNFTKIVQRVPVRIALPPHHPLVGRLVPGMSVEVAVDLRDRPRSRIAARR